MGFVAEFNRGDEAGLADVVDEGEFARGGEHVGEEGLESVDVVEEMILFEEVEAGEGGGAGERVAGVGVAVEKGFAGVFGLVGVGVEGVEDFWRGERGAQRHVAGGEAFGEAEEVGGYLFVFAGEHFAGAAESGEDFVGDEEDVVARAEVADFAEGAGGVEEHSSGALDDGF